MAERLPAHFISVDDHVQEPPDLWTYRLSKARWGDRIPHLERDGDGRERWVADGQELLSGGVARAGAFMPDRNREATCWDEVPPVAYVPSERLKVMDTMGADYSVLYPTVTGLRCGQCARRWTCPCVCTPARLLCCNTRQRTDYRRLAPKRWSR